MKGGKARPSRSIKRFFELFEVQKSVMQRGKMFFDTLIPCGNVISQGIFDPQILLLAS